jgi:general secretion pathway protein K
MSPLLRQRGAVLLVALLIVALAAAGASALLQQQDLAVRQLETSRDFEQAQWILKGGVQWARSILAQDARASTVDHAEELWATGLPSAEIEQGTVSGDISDQQGLFNLNNLVRDGKPSGPDIAMLKRLLRAVDLRAELADAIADWIDADRETLAPGGAEDDFYLGLPVPYRTANRPLAEMGELLRVRGCDEAAVARLRRVATVLPRRTPINVNFAALEVLVALVDGLTLSEALVLTRGRSTAPIRDRQDFRARLPRRDLQVDEEAYSVDSQFFLVQGRAKTGKADVRMESLLQREKGSLPVVVWQRML